MPWNPYDTGEIAKGIAQKLETRIENLEVTCVSLEERIASLEKHVINLLSDLIERKAAK